MDDDKNKEKKGSVMERYNRLALVKDGGAGRKCSCSPAAPSEKTFTIMSEDYRSLKGYEPEADLGVGCGLPTEFAGIKPGNTVVDLGSGAGNDSFIARQEVGDAGRVIGIDFAANMVSRARENASRQGYTNMEFIEGDIEDMPLPDGIADVVVSNCVLNLLPSKRKVFHEIYRVLRPGGRICVSDIVLGGDFPRAFLDRAAMYAGCIATAIQESEYLDEAAKAGFTDIKVRRRKKSPVPDSVLDEYLDEDSAAGYRRGDTGIYSITVTAIKE